jgi:hypothetical protein
MAPAHKIPPAARWAALLWLVVWVPAYWRAWGPANFLHLCDAAVLLTCLGLWLDNALLLSSQAVASLVADGLWSLDALWRLLLGRHLFGGTEYMFNSHFPLFVRLLSLFHVALPVLLLWALSRTGYDRRGLWLQTAIAAILLFSSRLFGPALNLNFAFRDPLFHRALGPAPVHLPLILVSIFVITYLPAHWLFLRLFSPAARS